MLEMNMVMMNKGLEKMNFTKPSRQDNVNEQFSKIFEKQINPLHNKWKTNINSQQTKDHQEKDIGLKVNKGNHEKKFSNESKAPNEKNHLKEDAKIHDNEKSPDNHVAKKKIEEKELIEEDEQIIAIPQNVNVEEILKVLDQLKLSLESEETSVDSEVLETLILQLQQLDGVEEIDISTHIEGLLETVKNTDAREKILGKVEDLLEEIKTTINGFDKEVHIKSSDTGEIKDNKEFVISKSINTTENKHQQQPTEEKFTENEKDNIEKSTNNSNNIMSTNLKDIVKDHEVTEEITKLMNETKANATLLDNNTTYTKEVHSKNILEQVIHKVDTIYKSGKNQLSLQLTPENLGKLSIKLISENNDIKAKVYVESLQVKEVIENNLNQLRDSLREKGIYIGSLEVSVGGDGEDFQKDRHLASNPFRIKSKGKETDINNSIRAIENITSQAVTNPYMLNSQFDKLV